MNGWAVAVGRRAEPAAVAVLEAFAARGIDAVPVRAAHRAGLVDGVRSTAMAGRSTFVVGGDGTINAVAEGLIGLGGDPPAVGILPAGTGSDFARMFALPSDPGAAVDLAVDGSDYPVDVGIIEGSWGERVVVNEAQAGLGGATAAFADRLPVSWGARKYEIAFWAALPSFRPGRATLHTVKGALDLDRGVVVVAANGEFFGGGMRIAPKASVLDGAFDLIVIDTHRLRAVSLFPRMKRGLHLTDRAVRRIVTPWFRLETKRPWPVEVDGDHLGRTPMAGRVESGAFHLRL
jgi:diacylglycerol kinase (ATP)